MATLGSSGGGFGSFTNFAALKNSGYSKFATVVPLFGKTTSSGGAAYATLRRAGMLSGYQVPSGKKFTMLGALFNGGTGGEFGIGHGDSDVGFLSSSAPTNFVQNFLDILTTGNGRYISFIIIIPEGRYPYVVTPLSSGNGDSFVYGYELDAEATSI